MVTWKARRIHIPGDPSVTADARLCLVKRSTGAPSFKWGQSSESALKGEADFASDCTPSIYIGGMWMRGSRLREEGAASGQREGPLQARSI
jgi:hypothetical protein